MHGAVGEPLSINVWAAVGIVIVCILISSFFSGSETALTAASRARMHGLEKNGDKRAATVNQLLQQRDRFIGAMLFGNTIVNIGSSAVATSLLVVVFGENGAIYATLIMTALLLIFAEVLPKTIAINYPDRMSLVVARPAAVFVTICTPILFTVEVIVKGFLRGFGVRVGGEHGAGAAHEDLKSAVDLMHQEGGVARDDRDMFGGVLDLKDLTVSDVMVHRTKMVAVNIDLPPRDLVHEVLASPHTRLPVWRGEPENIVGLLHAKDLLRALDRVDGSLDSIDGKSTIDLESIILEAWFVPDTTSLGDQLQAFRCRKSHFALVVDEYGVVMGLVTLEDILEEIVGEISDEHDIAVQGVRQMPDGSVIVDGAAPIRDINRVMEWRLPDNEATTIAGLVIHEARMIPEPGQTFTFHGFRFEVLRKTRNRITSLHVSPLEAG